MKDGYFAVYMGKEYTSHASRKGEKILLRSTDLRDIDKGFELCKPFKYRKYKEDIVCIKEVERSELESYYELRIYAYYKGYRFRVLDENDDMISIMSLGGDYRDWINLGMKSVDRFVYEKWIKKSEAEIEVEREER